MPSLLEIQQDFSAAVLLHTAAQLTPHLNGAHPETGILLYANTVRGTLSKALQAIYPVTCRLLGERCFDGLSHRFIKLIPSRSGDLHDYGEEFAEFVSTTPLVTDYPWLPDVIKLEWLLHRVFHARDATPLQLDSLQVVAPEHYASLCFTMVPASTLFESAYPVHKIWSANQIGQDGTVNFDSTHTRLLLLRNTDTIDIIPIGHGEYEMLSSLHRGCNIGDAVAAGMRAESTFDPQQLLASEIARGVYEKITLPTEQLASKNMKE